MSQLVIFTKLHGEKNGERIAIDRFGIDAIEEDHCGETPRTRVNWRHGDEKRTTFVCESFDDAMKRIYELDNPPPTGGCGKCVTS